MPTKHDLENLLNGELADLLSDAGIPAQAEVKQGSRRLDVLADVDGLRVVLEAETGFDKQAQAIKDADARFKQGLTTLAFAVCYPSGATVGSLADAELRWLLRTAESVGKPAPGGDWSGGSVQQLAEAVRQAPNSVADADKAAQMLSDGLDAAVQGLSTPVREALAKRLDLPRGKATAQDDGYFTAAKRGMLVVAMAMLFHHRVHAHLGEQPSGHQGTWPPLSAAECAAEPTGTPQRFADAWAAILEVDYKPVFETARVALFALPTTPDASRVIHELAKTIERIASSLHGMRHDLLGRVFHRVLDTARYDGSFYTSTAAATLLAALAIREEDCDWSDVDAVAQLRICDPACGTGTLLMAAADRIRALRTGRMADGQTDEDDEAALALCLVEDVLWGYDINLTATHMAASALGMLSPKTQFNKMRVYRTYLGVYGGVPYLGSLEFLEGQARLIDWPQLSLQVDDETGGQAPEQPPAMDLVIMNPPFTRDSLRHDQFSRQDELSLKQRETSMFADHKYRKAVHFSGSSTAFCVFAEKLLRESSGTLALILPSLIPTGPSGQGLRQFLAEQFHVETIVTSHDPERIYMSENTRIGEVLIVCRRWNNDKLKPATRVINLAENPSTPIAALNLLNQLAGGQAGKFTVQAVDSDRIAQGDWNAVNFFSPFLVGAYRSLTEDESLGLVSMSEIAQVGPAGQRIRDAYTRSDTPTTSGRRALWDHKTTVTQSMRGQTDVYIEPKAPKKSLADRYWSQRSRLVLAHRARLNLARVFAVTLDQPVVGSRWTPCRPHDGNLSTMKALAVFLNSSVGILSLLGGRDNRVPSYPQFSLDTLRSLRVPDFNTLADDARDALATVYNWRQDDILLPLPQMNDDPVRKQLDDAVTTALNLDPEWVAQVRRALSEEPSVTNRRFGS